MTALEDLDNNPVLQMLQTNMHESLYHWVQQHRGIVCVPHSHTVRSLKIDKEFLEVHTFQPSKLYKDHFVTNNKRTPFTILWEGENIITVEGYPESRTVKIIGEEIGYGKSGEMFRILLIDGPLVGKGKSLSSDNELFFQRDASWNHEMCCDFLVRFPECRNVMTLFDSEIAKFVNNYMVVAGHMNDAIDRLQKIWTDATSKFLGSLNRPYSSDARFKDVICRAVDSYLMDKVHEKVFPAIYKECEPSEQKLAVKCSLLKRPEMRDHILSPALVCDLTRPLQRLSSMEDCHCPHDKLLCLKDLLDTLTQEVNQHGSQSPVTATPQLACLTSDDYIPLLASVIIAHSGHHVVSNIFYMENFRFHQKPADNLSFCLVTFQAACSFVLNFEDPLKPAENTALYDKSPGGGIQSGSVSPINSSRWSKDLNRELDALSRQTSTGATTRRVPTSTNGLVRAMSTPNGKTNSSSKGSASSSLGEFLSALKADSRPVAYGKQN